MNSHQFALFTLAALCLFSVALSQTSGGIPRRGYWRSLGADEDKITINITVEVVISVGYNGTDTPINLNQTNVAEVNDNINNFLAEYNYFVIRLPNGSSENFAFPPNASTFSTNANTANLSTEFRFNYTYFNDNTDNATSGIIYVITNSTNTTIQQEKFESQANNTFTIGGVRSILAGANITFSAISVNATQVFVQPPPGNTTSTITSTTSTSAGSSTTTSTSLGVSLSPSSSFWIRVGTVACLFLAYVL